jgi:hypothetical protein
VWKALDYSKAMTDKYNGEMLHRLYGELFSQYKTLPSCTWLRAKGAGEITAAHVDYYYFSDSWRQPENSAKA